MLILGNYAVWKEIPVPGAKPVRLRIEAIDDDLRDAIIGGLGDMPPEDDTEARVQWWVAYGDEIALASIKAWEQVGTLGADGKPVPLECTQENIRALLKASGFASRVRSLVNEVNLRIAEETEAAGNA
jgi:hypothetical protein